MANPNRPPGVGFCPSDSQVIQLFLEPKINGQAIANCLIGNINLYDNHPRDLAHIYDQDYFARDEYWYFVNRKFKGPSKRIKRTVGNGNGNGRWVCGKTRAIQEDGVIIGEKQKFRFIDNQKRRTGWRQYEYRLPSPIVLEVVTHLVYKVEEDDTRVQAPQPDLDVVMNIAALMEEPEETVIQDAAVDNSVQTIMKDLQKEIGAPLMDINTELMEEPEENAITNEVGESSIQERMNEFESLLH